MPLYRDHGGENQNADTSRRPAARDLTQPIISTTHVLPSLAEMHALLTLSLEGDIVRLRERLKEMASRDVTLADFTREIEATRGRLKRGVLVAI